MEEYRKEEIPQNKHQSQIFASKTFKRKYCDKSDDKLSLLQRLTSILKDDQMRTVRHDEGSAECMQVLVEGMVKSEVKPKVENNQNQLSSSTKTKPFKQEHKFPKEMENAIEIHDDDDVEDMSASLDQKTNLGDKDNFPIIEEDPQKNPFQKPNYSISCLVVLALKCSEKGVLLVSEIFDFITTNFPYYAANAAGTRWKSEIQKTLTLSHCFVRPVQFYHGSRLVNFEIKVNYYVNHSSY
jgi:hypothetical protein